MNTNREEIDIDAIGTPTENALGLLDLLQSATGDVDAKSIRAVAGLAYMELSKIEAEIQRCIVTL